jgi:UDP-N-acetylglucosamine/UDP-N-acetylgalactosamine diphosphorylase
MAIQCLARGAVGKADFRGRQPIIDRPVKFSFHPAPWPSTIDHIMESIPQLMDRFAAAGQQHVFGYWDRLSAEQQAALAAEAREVDLGEIRRLVDTLVTPAHSHALDLTGLAPAPYVAHPNHGGDAARWAEARAIGEDALRAGRVACFVVAGGQGTRLGYPGPKGTFPVTPVRRKTLFQVFAEKILTASQRYGRSIPWFVLTNHINYDDTVRAFEDGGYFGLDPQDVHFFRQGRMPAVDFAGRIILESPYGMAMSPDGHGGSLRALVRSGSIATMQARGIDMISYFQVDNPLVQVIDPAFIGFHVAGQAEMSSKMIPKAYPGEKVGHFCTQNGRTVVIEYSDLPDSYQQMRGADGQLLYLAGSIAIHMLNTAFVARMGGNDPALALPFHRAEKKIPHVAATGETVKPAKPNGIKFEMFVFDALPFAANPVTIETLRSHDFSPVKNAEGLDSPQTCRDDQLRLWASWLAAAGSPLPTDASGLPNCQFEVSPLFADSAEAFAAKWATLDPKPTISDGTVLE